MNLYHLKTFYYIAKYKSYTRAAQELCVTQPAVTRQIQELENTHNLVLFNKIGKKIVLTDAGEALYALAEKIFDLETQVEESIRDFQSQNKGRIDIVSCETFAAYYLPSLLELFYSKFPDIFLSVMTKLDGKVIESTANLDSDIGFTSRQIPHPKLTTKEFLTEELIFIASPDNSLAKKGTIDIWELNHVPIILHEPGCGTWKIFKEFIQRHHLHTKDVGEFTNNSAIVNLVKRNLGLSLISKNVVREELKSGALAEVTVAGEEFHRRYYINYYNEKYFTKTLADFVTMATGWAADYLNEF